MRETSTLKFTYQEIRSALALYFEPLLWPGRAISRLWNKEPPKSAQRNFFLVLGYMIPLFLGIVSAISLTAILGRMHAPNADLLLRLRGVVSWAVIWLECWLCTRIIQKRILLIAPFFSAYIILITTRSACGFVLYHSYPSVYPHFYWSTALLVSFFRALVAVELIRYALRQYPGTRALVSRMILFLGLFAMTRALVSGSSEFLFPYVILRELDAISTACFVGLFVLIICYRMAVSAFHAWLMVSFALYSSISLISTTILPHFLNIALAYRIEYFSFAAALATWCYASFLKFRSERRVNKVLLSNIEKDYLQMVAETENRLRELRELDKRLSIFVYDR